MKNALTLAVLWASLSWAGTPPAPTEAAHKVFVSLQPAIRECVRDAVGDQSPVVVKFNVALNADGHIVRNEIDVAPMSNRLQACLERTINTAPWVATPGRHVTIKREWKFPEQ